ncbi:hypothetical protein [Acinetobacter pittii]|uniref:hypothetical protein n=1 Tax=Acinetobacter pittii TaxID=48296 RepID=UPI000C15E8C7|nr:hypothetical protein [Acinetobacter pittii]
MDKKNECLCEVCETTLKPRKALEEMFSNSPELKNGYITWWHTGSSYIAKTEQYEESANYWNQILNAWVLRQPDIDSLEKKVEELQKRVDAAHDTLTELKEKSEALHHRWNILSDSVALAEAEMIDMCVKELEQALKGELKEVIDKSVPAAILEATEKRRGDKC